MATDITVEKTLAVIKPDAMNQAEEIIEEIKKKGFKIIQVIQSSLIGLFSI